VVTGQIAAKTRQKHRQKAWRGNAENALDPQKTVP